MADAAEQLQRYGEVMAAQIAQADPPMTGPELDWAQQQSRDAFTDAATLSGQS